MISVELLAASPLHSEEHRTKYIECQMALRVTSLVRWSWEEAEATGREDRKKGYKARAYLMVVPCIPEKLSSAAFV